ncbi:MAG: MarR family winged helix-turn-helix transcriptional regulator [Pseudomonadota bacterium]
MSLRNAAHRATLHYDNALGEAGITVTMYRLLKRVDALETPSLTNMAASMGLDRSTLGRNVRVLEKQGLIRMEAGKDSRMAVARLTEAGRETLEKAHPLWAKAQAEMSELLGPEPEKILAVLARLGNPEMQDNDIVWQGGRT